MWKIWVNSELAISYLRSQPNLVPGIKVTIQCQKTNMASKKKFHTSNLINNHPIRIEIRSGQLPTYFVMLRIVQVL